MNCKICRHRMDELFRATVLNRHVVTYYRCGQCGFLATEEPYWLAEAYKSPINPSDTGILQRNILLCGLTSVLLFSLFPRNAKCVDYGGGYGLMTRMMRDIGFDFCLYDPHCENLFARGFEYEPETGGADLVTSFEAFEHFVDPAAEIGTMLSISKNILFTTELLPQPVPRPEEWWYFSLDHGQHVSFYALETIERIARDNRLNLYTDKHGFHFLTEKKLGMGIFQAILALHKFGFAHVVQMSMKSRTLEDRDRVISGLAG